MLCDEILTRDGSDDSAEKSSLFPLPRLSSSVGRKSSSGRPSTPNGSPKWMKEFEKEKEREKEREKEKTQVREKEREQGNTLRKRTTSQPATSNKGKDEFGVVVANGDVVPVKQGQSILEQIGEADHCGWMRKKGERYNSWRMRYFVLTGPHLYCLKSNSKAVSIVVSFQAR